MKLNAHCRQVPAASDGVPLIVSTVDQPHAVLPYVAVRRTRHLQMDASSFLLDGFVVVVRAEADKQAQESVTVCYITRNAAEAHDWCRGAGGTVRSFRKEMNILGICYSPIGAVVVFI